MELFFTGVIGAFMIWGVIDYLNRERASEGEKSLGCISILIVIMVILVFWWLIDKI